VPRPRGDTVSGRRASRQDAWRAARGTWKRSEAFLFGPADDLSVTGGVVDVWPAFGLELDALIAGDDGPAPP